MLPLLRLLLLLCQRVPEHRVNIRALQHVLHSQQLIYVYVCTCVSAGHRAP
jgi:hypothetical protein